MRHLESAGNVRLRSSLASVRPCRHLCSRPAVFWFAAGRSSSHDVNAYAFSRVRYHAYHLLPRALAACEYRRPSEIGDADIFETDYTYTKVQGLLSWV
jgi:hypothetical protein